MNVTTRPNERMVPQETSVDAWLDDVTRMAPNLVAQYLTAHGLTELPRPRYVNADMAVMYEPKNGEHVETIRNATPSGLVSALEKGLLLAPASAVERVVETKADPTERAAPVESAEGITYEKCPICKLEFKLDPAKPLSRGRFTAHKNRHDKNIHSK